MKKLFRLSVLALLAGGWALASSAIYVVRTPGKFIIVPKNTLQYQDTYVDTRAWTLSDDTAHPAVVSRLMQLGKTDALAHTVNTNSGPVDVQLTLALQHTDAAPTTASLTDKATAKIKSVADAVKSKI